MATFLGGLVTELSLLKLDFVITRIHIGFLWGGGMEVPHPREQVRDRCCSSRNAPDRPQRRGRSWRPARMRVPGRTALTSFVVSQVSVKVLVLQFSPLLVEIRF